MEHVSWVNQSDVFEFSANWQTLNVVVLSVSQGVRLGFMDNLYNLLRYHSLITR